MSSLSLSPSTSSTQTSNSLTLWPSRFPIRQATFEKLTSISYLFYSTQFIRSEVPASA
ncbi:hypothetical protein F4781DRAFT_402558 [Annulohypoxylon bovei var. microspora]|nr:hypothetical protein F4781DRAFT_402558 [Annulohypoxylon bovei var. microspora]